MTTIILAAFMAGALSASAVAHGQDRTSAWNEDLVVARDVFLSKDRSYSEDARRAAYAEIERTRARIDRLTDPEIVAGLARAAALSGNAHTRAYLLRNRSYWRRYPLRIWRFAESWHVIAARAEAVPIVGGRITHIQGVPVEQAFEKVRALYAGNAGWSDYMSTYTLTSPDALLGVGVLESETATFTAVVDGNSRAVRLRPEPLDARKGPEESWWFLSPQHPAADGWSHALDSRGLPQFLRSPELNYGFARCDGNVLYVRYSRAADAPGRESVRSFGESLLSEMAARPPARLVLDLRFNTGGNLQLATPLMESLAGSRLGGIPGAIAVLTSPATFSAGISAAAQLRAGSEAVLVGAHPGDRLDYWSEGGNVTLPNSGLDMHYADGLHQYSDAPVPAEARQHLHLDLDVQDLEPDIAVDWTWRDYVTAIDAAAAAATGAPLRCEVSA